MPDLLLDLCLVASKEKPREKLRDDAGSYSRSLFSDV
ncbi:hypothetical protein F383_10631 [Gossypium arboreum]|uniref:Uncharacterized protein n=1 Tax=Gossypium arboreum TaxID=29729 RepID=A0A0B0NST1_GOSAR|nr:hypothetical protein F383_10631 [Gossypium arboreum]